MNTNQPVLTVKRRLPSGRAVFGGLLVSLSVAGLLLASQIGQDNTFQQVVVARHDLAPGTVIGPLDVEQVRMRLSNEADWVLPSTDAVIGAVVLGPVGRDEFLQASNLTTRTTDEAPSGLAEVSIQIESSRAPAALEPGELVSILSTTQDADGARTSLVADRVTVLSYSTGTDSDFSGGDTVLRLGVTSGDTATAIINAAVTSDVSVLGVTGASEVSIPEETIQ